MAVGEMREKCERSESFDWSSVRWTVKTSIRSKDYVDAEPRLEEEDKRQRTKVLVLVSVLVW